MKTDGGINYNSPDSESDEPYITQLTIDTIPQTSKVFEGPEGVTVLPVARFQCKLNGMAAKKCKRGITESCNKRKKKCCPGLVCMNEESKKKKKKKCLPQLYEGQSCKKDSDCIDGFGCPNKSCEPIVDRRNF